MKSNGSLHNVVTAGFVCFIMQQRAYPEYVDRMVTPYTYVTIEPPLGDRSDRREGYIENPFGDIYRDI